MITRSSLSSLILSGCGDNKDVAAAHVLTPGGVGSRGRCGGRSGDGEVGGRDRRCVGGGAGRVRLCVDDGGGIAGGGGSARYVRAPSTRIISTLRAVCGTCGMGSDMPDLCALLKLLGVSSAIS